MIQARRGKAKMIDDPKPSVKITDVTKIVFCILVFLLLLILKKK